MTIIVSEAKKVMSLFFQKVYKENQTIWCPKVQKWCPPSSEGNGVKTSVNDFVIEDLFGELYY